MHTPGGSSLVTRGWTGRARAIPFKDVNQNHRAARGRERWAPAPLPRSLRSGQLITIPVYKTVWPYIRERINHDAAGLLFMQKVAWLERVLSFFMHVNLVGGGIFARKLGPPSFLFLFSKGMHLLGLCLIILIGSFLFFSNSFGLYWWVACLEQVNVSAHYKQEKGLL